MNGVFNNKQRRPNQTHSMLKLMHIVDASMACTTVDITCTYLVFE